MITIRTFEIGLRLDSDQARTAFSNLLPLSGRHKTDFGLAGPYRFPGVGGVHDAPLFSLTRFLPPRLVEHATLGLLDCLCMCEGWGSPNANVNSSCLSPIPPPLPRANPLGHDLLAAKCALVLPQLRSSGAPCFFSLFIFNVLYSSTDYTLQVQLTPVSPRACVCVSIFLEFRRIETLDVCTISSMETKRRTPDFPRRAPTK